MDKIKGITDFKKGYENKSNFEAGCQKAIVPFSFDSIEDEIKYFDQRRHNRNPAQMAIVKPPLYVTIDGLNIRLDDRLQNIVDEINRSKYILKLENDWDDLDAVPPSRTIYNRSVVLLLDYAGFILENYKVTIKAPEINPGKDGSIDLEWRMNAKLLINISNTTEFHASYYGETKDVGMKATEGFLLSATIDEDLAHWMRKLT